MMTGGMPEADWELVAMEHLAELGWFPADGRQIAKGSGERESWNELIIPGRLRDAITRINPKLPSSAVDEVLTTVMTATSRDALNENHRTHEYLTRRIRSVVYTDEYGAEQNPTVWLIDRRHPDSNDFLVANQVTVVDGEHKRRFDIVLYVNGMPLGFVELKKAGDDSDDLKYARNQLATYARELPLAFRCNVACVVSDGTSALSACCAATSPPTGYRGMTSGRRSAPPSNGCSPSMVTHRMARMARRSSSSSRWRPSPRNGRPKSAISQVGWAIDQCRV